MNRSLYRLSTVSGVQQWRVRFSEPLRDGPVLAGDVVYQRCPTQGIWAIDPNSGKRLWNQVEARRFVCRTSDHAFLADDNDHLLMVAGDDGSVEQTISLRRRSLAIVNTVDETLYLVTPAGALVCAKPDGTPRLTLADLYRARAHVPAGTETEADDSVAPSRPSRPSDEFVDPDDPLRSKSKIEPVSGEGGDADD